MASGTVRTFFYVFNVFFSKSKIMTSRFFESSHTFFRTLMKIERSLALVDFLGA